MHSTPIVLLLAALVAACDAPKPFGTRPVPVPVVFAPGAISTEAREYGITFNRDGTEAYFTRRAPGRRSRPEIHVARFVDGAWRGAGPAPFSTGWEESPFLTADGTRLIYSSRRDVPGWGPVRANANLWVVERTPDGWSAPEPLAGDVNKPRVDVERAPPRNESGAVVLGDGTLLYSTYEDDEWAEDIYVAHEQDGRYVDPRPMHLNSGGSESNPAMSPDGSFLVFQGQRDAYASGEDELYVSERIEYGWTQPRLLPPPINSADNEGYPSFSQDGKYFFFASDRHSRNGYYSIYYVETESLGLSAGAPSP